MFPIFSLGKPLWCSDMFAPLSFSLFSLVLLIGGQHADAQVQVQEPLGTVNTLGVVFENSTSGCQQAVSVLPYHTYI